MPTPSGIDGRSCDPGYSPRGLAVKPEAPQLDIQTTYRSRATPIQEDDAWHGEPLDVVPFESRQVRIESPADLTETLHRVPPRSGALAVGHLPASLPGRLLCGISSASGNCSLATLSDFR